MRVIGIDVGVTGAVGVVWDGGAEVYDLPSFALGAQSGGRRRELNPVGVHAVLKRVSGEEDGDSLVVFIEGVNARTLGRMAAFSLGQSFGMVSGILSCLRLSRRVVAPAVWKKEMRVGKDKEACRKMAIQMFPFLGDSLARVKDHNRAESLLIAAYGYRQLQGRVPLMSDHG